jgi:cell division protein FtsL
MITAVMWISMIVIVIVLAISVWVTKKAYDVKNEVDPIDNNPHLSWNKKEKK